MELEKLLLKKEEIPIIEESYFRLPIHQGLLDPKIRIDESIAPRLFPRVAEEWYEDLKKYCEELEEGPIKKWITEVYLAEKPKVRKEHEQQLIYRVWRDDILLLDNGLVFSFSVSRNSGGTLYIERNASLEVEEYVPFKEENWSYIKFNKEKAKVFAKSVEKINGNEGAFIQVYSHHNIDHYPGALFLRNWAIEYMNEVFRNHHHEL